MLGDLIAYKTSSHTSWGRFLHKLLDVTGMNPNKCWTFNFNKILRNRNWDKMKVAIMEFLKNEDINKTKKSRVLWHPTLLISGRNNGWTVKSWHFKLHLYLFSVSRIHGKTIHLNHPTILISHDGSMELAYIPTWKPSKINHPCR